MPVGVPFVELRHLRYFVEVAAELSFSKAARRLHVSQPAISRQIRDLESELGTELFVRQDNQVRLTEQGRFLLDGARDILAKSAHWLDQAKWQAAASGNRLVIAHFGTLFAVHIAPQIAQVRKRFPGVQITLVERDPGEALRELRDGGGGLHAVFSGEPENLDGLEHRTVMHHEPVIVLPADHALAKKRRLTLAQLAKEKWGVWSEQSFPGFGRPFFEACRRAGFEPQAVETFDDVGGVFSRVSQGDVVSYVGSVADSLPRSGVVLIPLQPGELTMPVSLLWRPGTPRADVLENLAAQIRAAEKPRP
jgi:DNA-binding transcriptional LysR family regulator